jgi:hypothetical protein
MLQFQQWLAQMQGLLKPCAGPGGHPQGPEAGRAQCPRRGSAISPSTSPGQRGHPRPGRRR